MQHETHGKKKAKSLRKMGLEESAITKRLIRFPENRQNMQGIMGSCFSAPVNIETVRVITFPKKKKNPTIFSMGRMFSDKK